MTVHQPVDVGAGGGLHPKVGVWAGLRSRREGWLAVPRQCPGAPGVTIAGPDIGICPVWE